MPSSRRMALAVALISTMQLGQRLICFLFQKTLHVSLLCILLMFVVTPLLCSLDGLRIFLMSKALNFVSLVEFPSLPMQF
jgi:hypothetical protein